MHQRISRLTSQLVNGGEPRNIQYAVWRFDAWLGNVIQSAGAQHVSKHFNVASSHLDIVFAGKKSAFLPGDLKSYQA